MNAKQIVESLLEAEPYKAVLPSRLSDKQVAKLPYWERDAIKVHKERMADVRARYGRDLAPARRSL